MIKKFIVLCFVFFGLISAGYCIEKTNLPSADALVENIKDEYINSEESGQENIRQIVTLKIQNGDFKGTRVITENILTGNPAYDIVLKKGSRVVLHLESEYPKEQVVSADDVDFYISDVKRNDALKYFALLFCVLLFLIGRKKGVFSLISIAVTVGLIFFMLVPMILGGFCPIASAVLTGIISTIVTIYLVSGFNPKSSSAIIGVCLSLIFAAMLSMLAIFCANLTGFAGEENLYLYGSRPDLDFKGILSASIILAALGAIMDVGVSISSTINEVYQTNSQLSVKDLFKSGMNVGKDIIGTMSNTLILVYIGSSLPLVLLSNNIDLTKFFNLNQVATEILSAIVGSTSLLACVPLTAIIAAFMIKKQKNCEKFE
ncbi:YibE/F family protein [bacterium]|nr:YibE/F family protein [bacterium]